MIRPSRCARIACTPSITSPNTFLFFDFDIASSSPLFLPSRVTRLKFQLNRSTQLTFLRGCQVGRFIFSEQREQPNLLIPDQKVVDDSEASSSPLASPLVAPPQLSKPAGARHHVASFRIRGQESLQACELVVGEVPRYVTGERGSLKELQLVDYTLYA